MHGYNNFEKKNVRFADLSNHITSISISTYSASQTPFHQAVHPSWALVSNHKANHMISLAMSFHQKKKGSDDFGFGLVTHQSFLNLKTDQLGMNMSDM